VKINQLFPDTEEGNRINLPTTLVAARSKAISEYLGRTRYAAPLKPLSRRAEEKFKQKQKPKAMKLCPVCGFHKPNKKLYFSGSICRYCRRLKKLRGGRDTHSR